VSFRVTNPVWTLEKSRPWTVFTGGPTFAVADMRPFDYGVDF